MKIEDSSPHFALPRRRLGRTQLELSVVSAGGWLGMVEAAPGESGPTLWGRVTLNETARAEAAIAAAQRAVALGINYFDTAPLYAEGAAETALGEALRALPAATRAQVVVSTKVGYQPERRYMYDADSIRWSLERSLQRLGCARVDIVYVHDPQSDADMDVILGPGGAVAALESLKAAGVVGAIGLGVRRHRFLRRAVESGRFDAILPSYDYTPLRTTAGSVLALAAQHGVGVVAASPYLAGLLAGLDPAAAAARRPVDHPRDLERASALWRWAAEREVPLGALAMQFCLRNPHVTTALAGPRTAAEVEANVAHATTPLPATIWEDLDQFMATLGPAAPGGEVDPVI